MKQQYILVDTRVAPDVFIKVVQAKKNLDSGKCKTVNDAIEGVKMSRSAFYKYKDYVFAYSEKNTERIYTLFFTLDDVSGIVSEILRVLAGYGSNVLTINQNIPIHNVANITISFRMGDKDDVSMLIEDLQHIEGINKIEILAME